MMNGTSQELEIFCRALDYDSPDQRERFLEQACEGNAALRERLERLLTVHEEEGEDEFLEPPTLVIQSVPETPVQGEQFHTCPADIPEKS